MDPYRCLLPYPSHWQKKFNIMCTWEREKIISTYTFLPFEVTFPAGLSSLKPDSNSPTSLSYSTAGLDDLFDESDVVDLFIFLEGVLDKQRGLKTEGQSESGCKMNYERLT